MKRSTIYDRNLKIKKEVSVSAFHFLFSEIVQYCLTKAQSDAQELERQLEELGKPLGAKFLELTCYRDRSCKKDTNLIECLRFIHGPLWRSLFNKPADELEQNTEEQDVFMISEKEPSLCNQFACLPRGEDYLNCASFVAGIIEGVLNAANYPAKVSAIFKTDQDTRKTVFLVKFTPDILERDRTKNY